MSLTAAAPTVVVVEDDDLLLKTLTTYFRMLDWRIRGFASATAFLESLAWSPSIDCIISDVRMDPMDGFTLLLNLRKRGIAAPVVLMTGQGDVPLAIKAIKAGAFDFLEKPFQPEAIEKIVKAAIIAAKEESTASQSRREGYAKLAQLTQRQSEIVELLIKGLTSKEIAVQLGMSFRTVQVHRAAIMDRLGLESLADLIRLKLSAGSSVI